MDEIPPRYDLVAKYRNQYFLEHLGLAQAVILKAAHHHQETLDEYHIQERDRRTLDANSVPQGTEFPVNSYVLRHQPSGQRTDKFAHKWIGPLPRCLASTPPVAMLSSMSSRLKTRMCMCPNSSSSSTTTIRPMPRTIPPCTRKRSSGGEHSRHMKVNPDRRATMRFLVRWTGYGPDSDSWEPWENVYGRLRRSPLLLRQWAAHALPRGWVPPPPAVVV